MASFCGYGTEVQLSSRVQVPAVPSVAAWNEPEAQVAGLARKCGGSEDVRWWGAHSISGQLRNSQILLLPWSQWLGLTLPCWDLHV